MTLKLLQHLQSREKKRLNRLLKLKPTLSLLDYFRAQSIFSDDYLYFSYFELFMNKKDKLLQGRYFVDEWMIFLIIDKTIKKWLLNNQSLDNIKILVNYCGSGMITHIVIECLLIHFKTRYPAENNQTLLKKIINNHVVSWDVDNTCLDMTKNRIKNIFNIIPVTKHATTILENEQFDIILGHIPFGNLLSNEFKNSINSNYEDIALDFIDSSLQCIKNNGEIFYFVNAKIIFDKIYIDWRQEQYNNLTLHTVIDFLSYQHKENPICLIGIGLNNQKNYTINYYDLDNFTTKENIAAELFYQKNKDYCINLK